jgi:predicted nucleic acid-binding protein
MTRLTAVLDANMVIGLAKGGVFDLLASVYAPLYIPAAVTQEVIGQGQGRAGAAELARALGGWITEVTPTPHSLQPFRATLRSRADRQVIAVAQAHAVDHLLTNDGRLAQVARRQGFRCLEVPEVVLLLKRRKLLSQVKSPLDRMLQQGFGIADAVYEQTLRAAGEWPTS